MPRPSEARPEADREAASRALRGSQAVWTERPGDRWSEVAGIAALDDLEETLEHLAAAVRFASPNLALELVARLRDRWRGRGLPDDRLRAALEALATEVDATLAPRAAAAVLEVLTPTFAVVGRPTPEPPRTESLPPDAVAYLEALREGDAVAALALVDQWIDAGRGLEALYLEVLEPAQHEIGRLWQVGTIGVAEEHFTTAVTQRAMTKAYARLSHGAGRRGRLVAACVSGELHEIGLRMVTDILELRGWDTHYLGASTPTAELVRTVVERDSRVVVLSVMTTPHLFEAKRSVDALRAACDVRIVVGGYPFHLDVGILGPLGADAWAADALEASALLETWRAEGFGAPQSGGSESRA